MPSTIHMGSPTTDLAAFASEVRRHVEQGAELRLEVGEATCAINGALAAAIVSLVDVSSSGGLVDVSTLPAELTTGQAADLLGVSRPTVVSLVDAGTLPASRIGTHRRLRTVDVLAHRARSQLQRSAALDELTEISEDLGLYDS